MFPHQYFKTTVVIHIHFNNSLARVTSRIFHSKPKFSEWGLFGRSSFFLLILLLLKLFLLLIIIIIIIIIIIVIIIIIIIIIIHTLELLTSALADGFSPESEWQLISSSLQDSS